MPDRFEALWNGEGEPGATARLPALRLAPETDPTRRLRAFGRAKLDALPRSPIRRDLDRLVVKLCWKLHAELAFARAEAERLGLLAAFAELLAEVELRRLEVEPPDLVEQVVVREPAPPPAVIPPQQAMGLFYEEEDP